MLSAYIVLSLGSKFMALMNALKNNVHANDRHAHINFSLSSYVLPIGAQYEGVLCHEFRRKAWVYLARCVCMYGAWWWWWWVTWEKF